MNIKQFEIDGKIVERLSESYILNGRKQDWYFEGCFSGDSFLVNEERTHVLFPADELSQFSTFELFEIPEETVYKIMQKLEQDKGKGFRRIVSSQNVLLEAGYSKTWCYALHKDPEKLMPFDEDELRETNPELFI